MRRKALEDILQLHAEQQDGRRSRRFLNYEFEAGARIRFVTVSVEVVENNDDYITVVYEDDEENNYDDNYGSSRDYDDDTKNYNAKQYTRDPHRGINSI